MSKVIVERPRYGRRPTGCGSSYPRGSRVLGAWRKLEDPPTRESMSGALYRSKSLSENLSPLYRYLRTQVGRSWNKVYAEIAANLNRRSPTQLHIFQHLFDRLHVHVLEVDGVLMGARRWGGFEPITSNPGFEQLYVCPKTGVLKVAPLAAPRVRPTNPDLRKLAPDVELRRLNGIWFEVRLAPVPAEGAFDVLAKTWVLHQPGRWAAVAKRQLCKRELARHFPKR